MTDFYWRQFRFVVREMSYEDALLHFERIQDLTKTYPTDVELVTRNQTNAMTKLCMESVAIDVYQGDTKLPNGTHNIADGIAMTLPLRFEDFDSLPSSLTLVLVQAINTTSDAGFELIRYVENLPPESPEWKQFRGDTKLH